MAVAKVIQVIASSTESFDAAVKQGVAEASKSVRGITGIKVHEMTADIENDAVTTFKVTMEVAFKVQKEG